MRAAGFEASASVTANGDNGEGHGEVADAFMRRLPRPPGKRLLRRPTWLLVRPEERERLQQAEGHGRDAASPCETRVVERAA